MVVPRPAAAILVAVLCVGLGACQQPPNIVMILTDDQSNYDAKGAGGKTLMPLLARHIVAEGTSFDANIVNFALCCPSRTTILTGQCMHNTGVVGNYPPLGSVHRFNERGLDQITAPLVLQQAGYRTGLIGKYLNAYGELPPTNIPQGWERWFAMRDQGYYNWSASDQGVERQFGTSDSDYSTDVFTAEAVDFIETARNDSRPFFLFLTPFAPHLPALPARRHMGTLKGLKVPRVPSWNESDTSMAQKMSPELRELPPLTHAMAGMYDFKYQKKAESLLAVDEQVEAVVQALESIGQLNNTYVFYASDNGFKLGHRRKTEKSSPYEEDVRVPLHIRGPGVARGARLPHLITNTDYAPTWLDLAGVPDPWGGVRDGKSFAHILRSKDARAQSPDMFRIGVLIEKLNDGTRGGIRPDVVSTMVPVAEMKSDVFAGFRVQKLPNGSWPEVPKRGSYRYEADDERDQGTELGWKMLEKLAAQQGIPLLKMQRSIDKAGSFPDPYYAMRLQSTAGSYKFIQYPEGYELYDLVKDPYEIENIYSSAAKSLKNYLKDALDSLKTCTASTCSVYNITSLRKALKRKRRRKAEPEDERKS